MLLSLITISLRSWKFIGIAVLLAPLHGGISSIGTFLYSIFLVLLPPIVSLSAFILLCFSPSYPRNKLNDLPITMRVKEKSIIPAKERLRGLSTCLLPITKADYNHKLLNSCSTYSLLPSNFSKRLRKLVVPFKAYSPRLKRMVDGEFYKMYKDLED